MKIRLLSVFLLLFLFSNPVILFAQGNVIVETSQKSGLLNTIFKTKKGTVEVYVPEDIRNGDIISGSVIAEPANTNPGKPGKSSSVLNGYVVEIQGEKTPVGKGKQFWTIPQITGTVLSITLLDQSGKKVSNTSIPVQTGSSANSNAIFPVSTEIPDFIISDELCQIPGKFDGNLQNTSVKINNENMDILAESPRGSIFVCNENAIGRSKIEVIENGFTSTHYTNVLRLNLSSGNTRLLKGESTLIKVEVSGLDSINRNIPVTIINDSPSTIKLSGGNNQIQRIKPNEIIAGKWQKEITATGISTGSYSIAVRIDDAKSDAITVFPAVKMPPGRLPISSEPLVYDPNILAIYADFAKKAGILFDIKDFNLPKKYKYDKDKETVALGNDKDFNEKRKKAEKKAEKVKIDTDSTKYEGRTELKGNVGFKVYYSEKDKNGCYWISTDWFFWKCDEYYTNRWRINRELDDILRFNNIKVDVNGNIDMKGSVETGGLETTAEIGISIPVPGVDAGVGVSYSPPSTAELKAKGTLKGDAKGYLDGKTMVIYIYKDTYHVERAFFNYYFRIKQFYCNDKPAGDPIYETTMLEGWEKYNEIITYADVYLVTEGIPTGPDSVHRRVETLSENQNVHTDIKGIDTKTPEKGEAPSKYFEGIK